MGGILWVLQHTTAHCNILQLGEKEVQASYQSCNSVREGLYSGHWTYRIQNTLLHTATHCNTLQHTDTHCNTLQHTAKHCNTLQHTATHCNTLQHAARHCIYAIHIRLTRFIYTLQHTATHCNTLQSLQHTATHCTHTFDIIHTYTLAVAYFTAHV